MQCRTLAWRFGAPNMAIHVLHDPVLNYKGFGSSNLQIKSHQRPI